MLRAILDLLFPPRCILCRKILRKDETDLCHTCRIHTPQCSKPKKSPAFLAKQVSLWYYEGNVRASLLRYKFSGRRNYAPAYGRLLAMKISGDLREEFDVLTWVPVSKKRQKKRGYDQVALLAQAVGQELDLVPAAVLRKTRDNPPQSRIQGQAKRKANVLGAYTVTDPQLIRGKRVLLLDDILTTGATVSECARTLLTAGAKEVSCAVLAIAPHYMQQ